VRPLRDAIGVGFREWRTVAVLLVVNWLVALLMVAPSVPVLSAAFGHAPLAAGRPLMSSQLLLGLGPVFAGGGVPSVLAPLVLLVVLQTLVVGGVVWRACAGGPFRLGAFLGQSGRLVWRNARLYLWSLPLLVVALGVPIGLAFGMKAIGLPTLLTLHGEAWLFGRPFTVASVLHLVVLVLAFALWRLCLDVGRVLLFRDDLRSVLLYALLGALATLVVILLVRARAMLPEGTAGLALLALAVGQVVVWARLAFQVAGTRFAAGLVEASGGAPPAVEDLTEPPGAERTG
jgi:hypothetical protein